MLDHFGLVVKDLARSVAFYENSLRPLGLQIIERHDYGAVIIAKSKTESIPFIWIGVGRPSFWQAAHAPSASPMHLCFTAKQPNEVDAFYQAAIQNGGRDNGAPGNRGEGYYAAYVIDPDGNNVEASVRYELV